MLGAGDLDFVMDAQTLGLPVPYYDPLEHYDIVKNKWIGLRPPPPPAPDE